MLIKICGITNADDALAALDAGADWIGLNMVAGPRKIAIDRVCDIVARLADPNRVVVLLSDNCVGKQRDESLNRSDAPTPLLDQLVDHGVRRLQLYGDVAPDTLAALHGQGVETIVVRHVADRASLDALDLFLSQCPSGYPNYVLFDAPDPHLLGGTGRCANWRALIQARQDGRTAHWPPFLLAGGLNPENVAEAVQTVRPSGVDVSSGVEASPGKKDREAMRQFVDRARAVPG